MAYRPEPQHRDVAHSLLKARGIPRDSLPYTDEFIELYIEFCNRLNLSNMQPSSAPTYAQFWKLLCGAAKRGGLAREPKDNPGDTAERLSAGAAE